MPDHTASFQIPFSIPTLHDRAASKALNYATYSDLKPPPADSRILPTQLRLAQIAEMIHVASLLHDDVLDRAETRRTASSAPSAFGNKLSILGGDFLLGRASAALARLGENEAVELVATVLSNLVEGEVLQMRGEVSEGGTGSPALPGLGEQVWTTYIRKSYLKTASLMAKFSRASVVLGGALPGSEADEMLKDVAYAYGRNIGIAFQVHLCFYMPTVVLIIQSDATARR
jgi:hexaprenyl-diphosphate synthase